MDRTQADQFITSQARAVFSFALKRCACLQDAEDVAQEIVLRAYQALLTHEGVTDPVRYLWTIAHNVLANHYRDRSRVYVGICDQRSTETDPESVFLDKEAVHRLRQEIAYLSRTQREIVVAYYFHGRKQEEIARQLRLPLGTVKWHLFEAKKELKRNMETPRIMAHLTFDPIRFTGFTVSGSIGSEGSPWRIFRSTLAQNIAYACWKSPRSMTEIAQALGISPVYLEDVLEQMTQQGYLLEQGGRYLCAILLTEFTDGLTRLSDQMYQGAAKLIAPELYHDLLDSDLWSDDALICHDRAFGLWALIPWCIASCPQEKTVPFDAVASIRPDGANNLCTASLAAPEVPKPALHEMMDGQFSGPCWNEHNGLTLWQLDTVWSEHRIGEIYQAAARTNLTLMQRLLDGDELAAEEYALLAQQGLIRTAGNPGALFRASLAPLWLRGTAIRERVLTVADNVYRKHKAALGALKKPYADALMADTPPHLRKLREYSLQNVYHGHWFIVHCLHTLVETQLLPLPPPEERAILHTILLTE